MFCLTEHQCKLTSFNPRAEIHGDDPKPAADIRFDFNVEATELAHFSPTLRGFLFHKDSAAPGDLVDAQHDAPNLRFPLLGALKWHQEYFGYELRISHGIGAAGITLTGDLNNFVFEPKEGGTVHIACRFQCHPDEKQFGKLCQLIAQTVDITLTPPEAEDAEVLTEKKSKTRRRGNGEARLAH
jgi:hypothetical protein